MDAFDEMRRPKGMVANAHQAVAEWLHDTQPQLLDEKWRGTENLFRRIGITFNVYGEDAGAERLIPFDIIPRSLASSEWTKHSKGFERRLHAPSSRLAKTAYSWRRAD